jgi:uncharacterized protein (DUF111 family)
VQRQALQRELQPVETRYGTILVKVARLDGRIVNAQPEYDDCASRALECGVPVKEVLAEAAGAWRAARGADHGAT